MSYTVEVHNLKSGGVSLFKFKNSKECERFVDSLKDDVYSSLNKHIRNEGTPAPHVLESFVVYTSLEDLERVTVRVE